jgi:hypothetical protein
MKKFIFMILFSFLITSFSFAGTTTNFGWDYGTEGQDPWWDIWTGIFIDIDSDVFDLVTLSGVTKNSTTLGTFTGTTIPDSSTIKTALQSLETALEAGSGTGKGYLWIPAGSMIPDTCSGLLQYDTGTNIIDYLAFDYATQEYAVFMICPEDWNAGTIKAKFVATVAATIAGTNNDIVIWALQCTSVASGETAAVTWGTAQTANWTYSTADETGPIVRKSVATPAITLGGTPAAGECWMCRVYRDSDDAGDTYDAGATSDAWLLGVQIEYTKMSPTPF